MAGSYHHIMDRDHTPGDISLIETMGDARECIEELLFLVRAIGTNDQIDNALDVFYAHKRNENPKQFREAYSASQAIYDSL